MRRYVFVLLVWSLISAAPAGPSRAMEVSGFTVMINGTSYTRTGDLFTTLPIVAVFYHPDPKVSAIRMKNLTDPLKQILFPIGKPVILSDHEAPLKAGHRVRSEFVALDEFESEYDEIILTFLPGR